MIPPNGINLVIMVPKMTIPIVIIRSYDENDDHGRENKVTTVKNE